MRICGFPWAAFPTKYPNLTLSSAEKVLRQGYFQIDISCAYKRNRIIGITDIHRVKCLFLDGLFLTKLSQIFPLR